MAALIFLFSLWYLFRTLLRRTRTLAKLVESSTMSNHTAFNHTGPLNDTTCKLPQCMVFQLLTNTLGHVPPTNQVSWQSAFWPLMACMLAVTLQESGRVCDLGYRYSYALRSFPFVCAHDVVLMLLKFVRMMSVGCSIRTAARHVWYDRFLKEEETPVYWKIVSRFGSLWHEVIQLGQIFASNAPSVRRDNNERHSCSGTARLSPVISENDGFEDVVEVGSIPLQVTRQPRTCYDPSLSDSGIIPRIPTDEGSANNNEIYCSGALPADDDADIHSENQTRISPATTVDSNLASTQSLSQFAVTSSTPKHMRPQEHRSSLDMGRVNLSDIPEERSISETSVSGPNDLCDGNTEELRDLETGLSARELKQEASPTELAKYYSPSGTMIDRTWRLSMVSFLFGALPQAIKTFGMKGVPFTQACVAMMLASFVTSELMRLVAGPPGKINLHAMPIVRQAKSRFDRLSPIFFVLSLVYSFFCVIVVVPLAYIDKISENLTRILIHISIFFIFSIPSTWVFRFIAHRIFSTCTSRQPAKFLSCTRIARIPIEIIRFTSDALAIRQSRASFLIISLFLTTLYCFAGRNLLTSEMKTEVEPDNLPFVISQLFFIFPTGLFFYSLLCRIVFMGSFSSYPRHILGLHGNFQELLCGTFVFLNIIIVYPTVSLYDTRASLSTYKPDWAEHLG